MENFLSNKKYSEEQVEFFLQCREEGMSVKEIEQIAIPGATVNVMTRLKKIRENIRKKED